MLAVAGNILSLPLFFGVDFTFGSVAVMMAVALLGTIPAVLVAAAGGLYTIVLWGHPYAFIIFIIEALFVSQLYKRGFRNLLINDLTFWSTIGIVLIVVIYRGILGWDWGMTTLLLLKQPLNALGNALLASLIIVGLKLFSQTAKSFGLEPPRLQDLLFHGMLTLSFLSSAVFIVYSNHQLRTDQESSLANQLDNYSRSFISLIGMMAHSQQTDWQHVLNYIPIKNDISIALVANDGKILASKGKVTQEFLTKSKLLKLDNELSIWLPQGDMPTMTRWRQGQYNLNIPIKQIESASHLAIFQAAKPIVMEMENTRRSLFILLASIMLSSLLASSYLSRWLTRPLRELEVASRNIPKLVSEGIEPVFPDSNTVNVDEYNSLKFTIQQMSHSLVENFSQIQHERNNLETEVKSRTQQLFTSMTAAEKANQAKSEFLSSMSHELRTPLNAVLGFSELLATDTEHPLNEDQLESLSYVRSAGQHLLRLVEDVLDLSTIEEGHLKLNIETIEIKSLIADICRMVSPQASHQGISIDNTIPDSSALRLKADYTRVKQVLLNIASNAIKYNCENGLVTLASNKTSNDKVRITISDTGEGVPEASFDTLFEPFNRLNKANSTIEGTGIGLTICKQLVELMGGEIGVFHNPDKGMTFWVEFEQS